MEISEIFKTMDMEVSRSERASINSDIIALYRTEQETKLRKLKNIERYKLWLQEKRIRHSTEMAFKFKKSNKFLKEMTDRDICVMLGHVKTNDLDLVFSTCKDLSARGKSVASYIYSLAYAKTGDNRFDNKR